MQIRLGLIGFGHVGQGFLSLLAEKKASLLEKYGVDLSLVFISGRSKGSLYNPQGINVEDILESFRATGNLDKIAGDRVEDVTALLSQEIIDILAEATPTNLETGEPGLSYIQQALSHGVSVTTTNKGPVALAYEELCALGRENKASFLCEGTVLSGTPAISLIENSLAGCAIEKITGILNGTTNYMLTQMEKGVSYEEALEEAQKLGYAESDPTADVDGWDAAVKVVILGKIIYGAHLFVDKVRKEGIRNITPQEIEKAKANKECIRLLGTLWKEPSGEVRGEVAPMVLKETSPLARVRGATNALSITTDVLGHVSIMGPGAGSKETGQALLVDTLALAVRMKSLYSLEEPKPQEEGEEEAIPKNKTVSISKLFSREDEHMKISEVIQTGDWKGEKHVPVIQAPQSVKAGEVFDVTVSVGKEIAHPNTTEHYIKSIKLYYKPKDGKFVYDVASFDFNAHGEAAGGPNTGPVYTEPCSTVALKISEPGEFIAVSYCNIHGLWESSVSIDVE